VIILKDKELENWIIIKLYRRKLIGKPIDFDDLFSGKKIDKNTILKQLKKMEKEGIVKSEHSNKSSRRRWALHPHNLSKWEKIALDNIKKGF